MPLSEHENPSTMAQDSASAQDELHLQTQTLVDLDEPEALLETLTRIAIRKHNDAITPSYERQRWFDLANALKQAEAYLNTRQSPAPREDLGAHKPAEHPTQSPPPKLTSQAAQQALQAIQSAPPQQSSHQTNQSTPQK